MDFDALFSTLQALAATHGLGGATLTVVVILFVWRFPAFIKEIGTIIQGLAITWSKHVEMTRIQDREDKRLAALAGTHDEDDENSPERGESSSQKQKPAN